MSAEVAFRAPAGAVPDPGTPAVPPPGSGEPLRVAHVIHNLQPGGAEQTLLELAQAAPTVNLDLTVLALRPVPGSGGYPDRLRAAGARVVELPAAHRWDPLTAQHALAALREHPPQVLHTHLKHADLVGAYVARRLKVPLVSTLHVIEDSPTPLGRVKRSLGGLARASSADTVVAVSDAVRSWYLEAFPRALRVPDDRVVTVRNGVGAPTLLTPERRAALRAELGAGEDDVLAVMVAVMRPGKGHEDLLEAAAGMPHRLPGGRRLVIALAGDGPLRRRWEDLARRATVPVVFAGYRTDVGHVLAAADLVVHPTHFDALPTALIEALAAGRPAVASSVGGVPEIVVPEVGVLVPPHRPDALAAAVLDLADDPVRRERLGAAARVRFDEEFEAEHWVERLVGLYRHLLSARGTGPARS